MPKPHVITVRFDGGSRGNPGPAGAGVVLEADDGTVLRGFGLFLGHTTNNVAEYRGLIAGLEAARQLGAVGVHVRGDSELVVKQLLGDYRVKNETLKPLFDKATALLRQFEHVEIAHNTREHNRLADRLANLAIDKARNVTDDELPETGSGRSASDGPRDNRAAIRYRCPACGLTVRVEQPGRAATPRISTPRTAPRSEPTGRRSLQTDVLAAQRPLRCTCGHDMELV